MSPKDLPDDMSGNYTTPIHRQLAALCHRKGEKGREVLLVTSSEGRWILPKGWPMRKRSPAETAAQEAWEEAGVKTAQVDPTPIGRYDYGKELAGGQIAQVETLVYPARVTLMVSDFPESDQRQHIWVSPQQAAQIVQEPGLKRLLAEFCPAASRPGQCRPLP